MPSEGAVAEGGARGTRNHWFYLLPQADPSARLPYAARLTEKAWRQGDRVCLYCDAGQTQAVDDILWQFSPDSFLPHQTLEHSSDPCPGRIAVLAAGQPDPADWDTVIVLGESLPGDADRFTRLALIATSDTPTLQRARSHYRQLRELGIEAQIHDRRSASAGGR